MSNPVEVVIVPDKYTISSCGYDGQVTGEVPPWLDDLLDDKLTEAINPIWIDVGDVRDDLLELEVGFNHSIYELEQEDISLHYKIDTNVSRLDDNVAGIIETQKTYVTEDEA